MTKKNRVGNAATDFTYSLKSGESKKMSSIKSEYMILMFSNPDCSTCAEIIEAITKSEIINNVISMNNPTRTMLSILNIYIDQDLSDWENNYHRLPADWINAYDKGATITKQKLYDVKAIPTLYLLDKNKKVILKDTSLDTIESFFEIP